jgi:hypothetical protein
MSEETASLNERNGESKQGSRDNHGCTDMPYFFCSHRQREKPFTHLKPLGNASLFATARTKTGYQLTFKATLSTDGSHGIIPGASTNTVPNMNEAQTTP